MNVFSKIEELSKCTQEIKLHLIDKIQNKINWLVKELKPILKYRYLIEKDIARQQGKINKY